MKNKKKKSVLCMILIVLLLAAAAAGVLLIRKWKEKSPEPAETTAETSQPETSESAEETLTEPTEEDTTEKEESTETAEETSQEEAKTETEKTSEASEEHPKAPELTYLTNLEIPPYDTEPYVVLNDGLPFFDTEALTPESYEIYYDLDELGRCTLADAVVGQDLMPDKKRENISSVHPTGWQKSSYPGLVDGDSLYNRCHLIAFGLTAENANPYNLVTGTRYFNTKGVNDFENLVIDYIRETGNHVRYRVTPVWTGTNLVCDGEVLEAWSIEDKGEAICFCIFAYNVQPGIVIDYATGDNWAEGGSREETTAPTSEGNEAFLLAEDYVGTFVLNTKKKKIHLETCPGIADMSEKNKEVYTGSYNALILQGYRPDTSCIPQEFGE